MARRRIALQEEADVHSVLHHATGRSVDFRWSRAHQTCAASAWPSSATANRIPNLHVFAELNQVVYRDGARHLVCSLVMQLGGSVAGEGEFLQ